MEEDISPKSIERLAKAVLAQAIIDATRNLKNIQTLRRKGLCRWEDVRDSRMWITGRRDRESLDYWCSLADIDPSLIIKLGKILNRWDWDKSQLHSLEIIEILKIMHLIHAVYVLLYRGRRSKC